MWSASFGNVILASPWASAGPTPPPPVAPWQPAQPAVWYTCWPSTSGSTGPAWRLPKAPKYTMAQNGNPNRTGYIHTGTRRGGGGTYDGSSGVGVAGAPA